MRLFSPSFLLLAACFCAGLPLRAQNNFEISGKIIDAETRAALPGASILVVGSTRGAIADRTGAFRIAGLPAQTQRLLVRHVDYLSDSIPLAYTGRDQVFVLIPLAPGGLTADTVQITGQLQGQLRALSQQRNAANIQNIVSAEQIEQFPDMNAAEAIQRIPGITLQRDQGEGRFVQLRGTPPQLSNYNINGEQVPSPEGDVRYLGLDVIPVDQLAGIQIIKALTPDQDGDAIGGLVNLITKNAGDTAPEIRFVAAGTYNSLRGAPGSQLQFSYGGRKGPLGFYLNASHFVDNRETHNMEFRFNQSRFAGDTSFRIHYDDVQLRHYTLTRQRTGLSATLDYQLGPGSQLYLRGMYNRFSDAEDRRRLRYNIGSGFLTSETSSREAEIERDLRRRTKIQTLCSVNFGGSHEIGRLALDYQLSYALASESVPDRIDINFSNDLINLSLDLSEPNWPRVQIPRPADSLSAFNYADYDFDEMLILRGNTRDENYSGYLNLRIPYLSGAANSGFLKFGLKARVKDKVRDNVGQVYHKYYRIFAVNNSRDSIRQIYNLLGPDLSLATLAGEPFEADLLARGYDMGLIPDPDKVLQFVEFYPQNFKIEENDTKEESHSEDYSASEAVYAAYGMAQHSWGPLMLLGGLRYERTEVSYLGYDVQFRPFSDAFDRIDTLRREKSYEFLLPQFHLRYRFNRQSNLRAALTWTYSRPSFEDILPYRQVEYDSREITEGNPDLRFASALNLDLLGETYLSKRGLIAGGVFFKQIDNFVYYFERRIFIEDISRAGWYFKTTAQNGERAQVMGAELTWNQMLSFLPGTLRHLGLYANYTFTHSEAYLSTRGEERERITLPGQARHVLNLALDYQRERIYLKLAGNYQSDFLHELGIGPDWDRYYDQAFHLDFNAWYLLGREKQLRLFVQAVNLTNTPLKYYMGRSDRVAQRELYAWAGRLGLKYEF
jgi:TonB-dependent receptor